MTGSALLLAGTARPPNNTNAQLAPVPNSTARQGYWVDHYRNVGGRRLSHSHGPGSRRPEPDRGGGKGVCVISGSVGGASLLGTAAREGALSLKRS